MRYLFLILAILAPCTLPAETLTAARVIRANAIIAPDDLAVAEIAVPGAIRAATDIVGLEARVTLYPGRPIMPGQVGPAALVERNQPVVLHYRRGGLTIMTEARALSRGGVGDMVRVMNLASRNTVTGRVRTDGSVEVNQEGSPN